VSERHNRYFDLSHFSLIAVSGEDAKAFLQNQITANLEKLDSHGWVLAAWCLPNGRIISNFILFQHSDRYLLVLPSMLKDKVIKRLGMFVLRSKVQINDAGDDHALIGLQGTGIGDVLGDSKLVSGHKRLIHSDGIAIVNFNDRVPRVMLVMSMDETGSRMQRILMACAEGNRGSWSLLDIESGIPWITDATSEKFLPQMLNLDLMHGLSFEKGCYPGQEVIARLHYKGEVKRRLYLGSGSCDVTPGPGDELENADDGHKIGALIDAEPAPEGGFRFLAVADVKLDAAVDPRIRGSDSRITAMRSLAGD